MQMALNKIMPKRIEIMRKPNPRLFETRHKRIGIVHIQHIRLEGRLLIEPLDQGWIVAHFCVPFLEYFLARHRLSKPLNVTVQQVATFANLVCAS
jgi:hypothetical protein